MNTVFYAVGERVKPENVVNMAHAMGINHIWDNDRNRYDFDPANLNVGADVAPSHVSTEVAIGQFPITVVDHANGVATIAAGGVYRPAHFVKSVEGNGIKYTAPLVAKPLADEGVLTTQQSADLRYAMEQVMAPDAGNNYVNLRPNGFDTGGKSGTWELPNSTHNGDAWFVGFTPKLATAVWVGNKDKPEAIYTKAGKDIAGANIPGNLFEKVMQAGLKAVGQSKSEKIQVPGSFTGDTAAGEIATPSPTAPSPQPSNSDQPCQTPGLCPSPSNPGGPGKPSKSATPSPSQSSKGFGH
jgi:membrane peptidoglycan carboxypeptidase